MGLSLKLSKSEQKRFDAMLATEAPEVQKMVITWDDALAEREAVGEARGKIEGVRSSVELLLGARLGSVPSSVRQKLASIADLSRLSVLLGLAASADSLAEFEAALGDVPRK